MSMFYATRYESKRIARTLRTDHFEQFADPMMRRAAADLVTTDVWTSMVLKPRTMSACVTLRLAGRRRHDARRKTRRRVHALLPAHRGEEVAAEVITAYKA